MAILVLSVKGQKIVLKNAENPWFLKGFRGEVLKWDLIMEATIGFEPMHQSFADSCLTTWLCRHIYFLKKIGHKKLGEFCVLFFMERMTRLELATSTLARWRSTRWATSAYNGASDRNRTNDTRIFSPLLYQLSYRGKKWRPGTGSNRRPLAWQASVLTNWTTGPFGGNNRARTCDPLLVRQMLSQLSYAPTTGNFRLSIVRVPHQRYITFYTICLILSSIF